ncbi:MAG: hypothetical protein AAF821_19500 [Cyanobacteria bacterium P01_D01_bin.156]
MLESADNPQQDELFPSRSDELTLVDVSVVAEELALDATSTSPQQISKPTSGTYTIELFRDEAQVTATELLYGDSIYVLNDIDALQILKLQRRRSVIQKKLSNFLAGVLITFGLVLMLSPLFWLIKLFGLLLTLASVGYVVYFNWWIEQRRRGEFGLLLTTKLNTQVVITSHNLKAIQSLYQIMFGRLDGGNIHGEPLTVNMYTGETVG